MSLMKRMEKNKDKMETSGDSSISNSGKKDVYEELKEKVQSRLVEMADEDNMERDTIRDRINAIIEETAKEDNIPIHSRVKQKIAAETVDEVMGFGAITPYIKDESINEVMVNGPKQVYVEKNGKLEKTDTVFKDEDQIMRIIEKIISPLGRRIDESSPMVDARLPDGSRVNAIIAPLALNGPVLTIRKFSKDPYTIDDLVSFGTLSPKTAMFLKYCVRGRLNILVSGGTGSGKTTTLNVLSSFIPEDERIVTIEDAAELQLRQEHVVRLETRPPNIEGKGVVTVRDLVRNSLRMRPDRIIVGEVRTGEALDMLQAMNTGHDGSLTTGHANSPRDMLARLETMALMAGMEIPLKAIREQISSAVDLIIHQARFKDGSRKITHICEVQGMEGDVITLQDIFVFKSNGRDDNGKITGEFIYTGIKPKLVEKLEDAGIRISMELFG